MRDTLNALYAILNKERGVGRDRLNKAAYKVAIEFRNKPKTVEARKVYLRRVIEESLA